MLNVCFDACEYLQIRFVLAAEFDGEETRLFHTNLNLGGIRPDRFRESRREVIRRINPHDSEEEWEAAWREECESVEEILRAAKQEKELRLWWSSNPATVCGLFCLVSALEGIDCRLYCAVMPKTIGTRPAGHDKAWDEAKWHEILAGLKHPWEMDPDTRELFARVWEKLAAENAELRATVDDVVQSVPIDYLDSEILAYAPLDEDFLEQNLVGWAMQSRHYMIPSFIEERINVMIREGLFSVVSTEPLAPGVVRRILRPSPERAKRGG